MITLDGSENDDLNTEGSEAYEIPSPEETSELPVRKVFIVTAAQKKTRLLILIFFITEKDVTISYTANTAVFSCNTKFISVISSLGITSSKMESPEETSMEIKLSSYYRHFTVPVFTPTPSP